MDNQDFNDDFDFSLFGDNIELDLLLSPRDNSSFIDNGRNGDTTSQYVSAQYEPQIQVNVTVTSQAPDEDDIRHLSSISINSFFSMFIQNASSAECSKKRFQTNYRKKAIERWKQKRHGRHDVNSSSQPAVNLRQQAALRRDRDRGKFRKREVDTRRDNSLFSPSSSSAASTATTATTATTTATTSTTEDLLYPPSSSYSRSEGGSTIYQNSTPAREPVQYQQQQQQQQQLPETAMESDDDDSWIESAMQYFY